MANWISGAVLGFFGLVGLLVASKAHDDTLYYAGLVAFLLAVSAVYYLILRATGHPPRRGPLDPAQEP